MKQTMTEQSMVLPTTHVMLANGSGLFGTHTTLPLSLSKTADLRYFINFQGFINYNRILGGKHEVDAFVSYFNENMMKNGDLPYDRLSLMGHVKYGYDSRYYITGRLYL